MEVWGHAPGSEYSLQTYVFPLISLYNLHMQFATKKGRWPRTQSWFLNQLLALVQKSFQQLPVHRVWSHLKRLKNLGWF